MDRNIKNLFERYESGQASEDERQIVEDWFNSFNNGGSSSLKPDNKAELFSELDKHIIAFIRDQPRKNPFIKQCMQIAAALFVISTAALLWVQSAGKKENIIAYTEIVTPKGAKRSFTLPDGSIVALNVDSKLRVPSNFGDQNREIFLSGEGYFSVKHNAAKPFIIHSDKLIMTDIGTSFDVKDYAEDENISITVTEGIVRVQNSIPTAGVALFSHDMSHNQQMVYHKLLNKETISYANTDNTGTWRNNQLRFDNASLDEIAVMIERWYNIPVKLNDKSQHCRRYTLSFQNEPVKHVLNVLANLSGITYQMKDNTIFMNVNTCKMDIN